MSSALCLRASGLTQDLGDNFSYSDLTSSKSHIFLASVIIFVYRCLCHCHCTDAKAIYILKTPVTHLMIIKQGIFTIIVPVSVTVNARVTNIVGPLWRSLPLSMSFMPTFSYLYNFLDDRGCGYFYDCRRPGKRGTCFWMWSNWKNKQAPRKKDSCRRIGNGHQMHWTPCKWHGTHR